MTLAFSARFYMTMNRLSVVIATAIMALLNSCKTLEQASSHGLNSGYYRLKSELENVKEVYLHVTEEQIDVYHQVNGQADAKQFLAIPLTASDSSLQAPFIFKKQSLDIDATSVLLKYRSPVSGLPAQLNADFNAALYVGWRFDNYALMSQKDPLGRSLPKLRNLAFDFGLLAGPGVTLISPFTTNGRRSDEYSGMVMQAGFAGFIESSMASFGIAAGYDYLLNNERSIWIYNNKPWIGFVVGIALD